MTDLIRLFYMSDYSGKGRSICSPSTALDLEELRKTRKESLICFSFIELLRGSTIVL